MELGGAGRLSYKKKKGELYWRDCSKPFQDALERQYDQMQKVEEFTAQKGGGKQVTWSHDLRQMRQTNQNTGLVKPLRRVRISPPVPPDDETMSDAPGTDASCKN